MDYTKIDVAEAHIKTAVRLFFEDQPPVPIHLLACSAREILTAVGKAKGVETVVQEVARLLKVKDSEVIRKAKVFVNFMKHADRDPGAMLKGFSDADNDPILFFACHDFGRIAGGMPVEAQVYEAWFFATAVKRVSDGSLKTQKLVKAAIKKFPRVRSVERSEKKRIGLRVLEQALSDPKLQMEIQRVVELPDAIERSASQPQGPPDSLLSTRTKQETCM